jgi:hypothetical protein
MAGGNVGSVMTRILLALGLLALASCATATAPAATGGAAPGSTTNPVTGTRSGTK